MEVWEETPEENTSAWQRAWQSLDNEKARPALVNPRLTPARSVLR